jgi:hypothetical protein
MSRAIAGAIQMSLQATLDQVPTATQGAIHVSVEPTDEAALVARAGESPFAVSAEQVRECSAQGCCAPPGTIACTSYEFLSGSSGLLRFSRSIYADGCGADTAACVHEIGHAILGMCHISAEAIGGRVDPRSLMATSPEGTINLPAQLTSCDLGAAQVIYGSALSPGATRAQLAAAGVVKP